MDHRTPLLPGSILNLDGLDCRVEKVVGRGSNAIVYKSWYPDRLHPGLKHHILIKELFPWHPAGRIYRDRTGSLVVEPDAREHWQFHDRSFRAGNEIHLKLLEKRPDALGSNLNSCSRNGTLYSVLGYSGGRTLEAELAGPDGSLRRCVRWMLDVLDALDAFHQSGYLHLDICPNNIMLTGSGRTEQLFLIDYNTAHALDDQERLCWTYNPGYSAPETELGSGDIGFSADLYSVCGVFFRCLMGRSLTVEEGLRAKAPDGTGSPLLKEQPPSVCDQVGRILRKGLNIIPGKRYQTTQQLREAFTELLDRIDGIGVTHWALWESGRRSLTELIRTNPALDYLTSGQELFPIRVGTNPVLPLEAFLKDCLSPAGSSSLILAHGGMGKTTLLLRSAIIQSERYSPGHPAVFYMNLNGLDKNQPDPVKTTLLLRLRFSRDAKHLNDAMGTLLALLEQPLQTRRGTMPTLLLLLDGLNEVGSGADALVRELGELVALAGVRIIAASRSPMPHLPLTPVRLLPLESGDIAGQLHSRGLPLPREKAVLDLLTTPLVFSLYLRSCDEEGVNQITSEGELIEFYLTSLLNKELRMLAKDSAEQWQIDAAIRLLLPVIAAGCGSETIREEKLLRLTSKCWKYVRSGRLRREFPQWTGMSKEITGGSEDPEQWYGLMVNRILWQRMGLLIRDPEGGIRIFHQNIAEHLSAKGQRLLTRIRIRRYAAGTGVAAAILAVFLTVSVLTAPRYYDNAQVEQVIDTVGSSCCNSGYLLKSLLDLTESAQAGEDDLFSKHYYTVSERLDKEQTLSMSEEYGLVRIDQLYDSGNLVSWSGLPLDGPGAKAILLETADLTEEYRELAELLQDWFTSERARVDYPDYPELFFRLLTADAKILSKRYHTVCLPHIQGEELWMEMMRQNASAIPYSATEPEETLEALMRERTQASEELTRMAAKVRLVCQENSD